MNGDLLFVALLDLRNRHEKDSLKKELVEKQKEEGIEGDVSVPDKVDWLFGTKTPPGEDDEELNEDSDMVISNMWQDDPDYPGTKVGSDKVISDKVITDNVCSDKVISEKVRSDKE